MGCLTRTTGRVINEKCDVCEHSLHWHNITYDAANHVAPMPEGGWPCLACDWERRMRALEWEMECRTFGCHDEHN